jgi:shikimate dehydrogenase
MNDYLEMTPDGWRLAGESWEPVGPFYAVLGDPIGHSLSPAMQNAAMAERGIDSEYWPIRMQPGQLAALKKGPAGSLLAGFNATAPLKEAVAALCDGRTDQARSLGAVNTVKVEDGKWLGHNTDSGGILTVLTQAWQQEAPPVQAVVLGAGGSARAAVDALARWDIGRIEVRNRSAAGQERFRQWASRQDYADRVTVTGLEAGRSATGDGGQVFVCCLAGGVPALPYLPDAAGPGGGLLLDIRYGGQLPPGPAPLGFEFCDGKPVLLMQGGLAFGWWFGAPIPWSVMRQALD